MKKFVYLCTETSHVNYDDHSAPGPKHFPITVQFVTNSEDLAVEWCTKADKARFRSRGYKEVEYILGAGPG